MTGIVSNTFGVMCVTEASRKLGAWVELFQPNAHQFIMDLGDVRKKF